MKFSGYQSNVQEHISTPHVYASGNPLAYGAGGAGLEAMGKAIGQVGQVVEKKQEEADTQDLLDAKNKLMTSLTQKMYNSDNGLFTTGYGENAKGLTDRVTQTVHDTYDEIAKDYNGRVQQALRKAARDNVDNFQRMAASRESAEAVKMKGVRYDNALKNGAQLCGLNYNNDEMINSQLADGSRTIQAMGLDMGLSGEQIVAKQRGMYTESISSAVDSAVNNNDYARARELLDAHKTDMDITTWNKLDKTVSSAQEKQDTYSTAKAIYDETDGDIYAARDAVEQACTKENGYFDVDKYDKMMARINRLTAEDKQAARTASRAAGRQVADQVEQMDTPETVEDYLAEHAEEMTEDELYWANIALEKKARMNYAATHGYKQKNYESDMKLLEEMQIHLQNGDKVSPEKWINAKYAGERLYEYGMLPAEDMESLASNGGDEQLNSDVTDVISVEGVSGGYNSLVDNAEIPGLAATVMSLRSDKGYMTGETDWAEGN